MVTLSAKQGGESGGTGCYLKHQWRKERHWHRGTCPRQWHLSHVLKLSPMLFIMHENIEKRGCCMVSSVHPFRGPRTCPWLLFNILFWLPSLTCQQPANNQSPFPLLLHVLSSKIHPCHLCLLLSQHCFLGSETSYSKCLLLCCCSSLSNSEMDQVKHNPISMVALGKWA